MLKKLLKHEFIATGRFFIPSYATFIILSIMTAILSNIKTENFLLSIVLDIFFASYIICIVALGLGSFIIAVVRFYRNLLTKEGYLSFTLPVKPSQLIAAKLIPGITWICASFVLCFLSLTLVLKYGHNISIFAYFEAAFSFIVFNKTLVIFTLIVLILATLLYALSVFYASLSCGQLFERKLLGSLVFYIVIYTITQMISGILVLALSSVWSLHEIESFMLSANGFSVFFLGYSAFEIILSIAFLMISNHMISKKLNL